MPPETRVSGRWLGEILISRTGAVVGVWPLREFTLDPPYPPFNAAPGKAIQQWEFAPALLKNVTVPVCMTVSIGVELE